MDQVHDWVTWTVGPKRMADETQLEVRHATFKYLVTNYFFEVDWSSTKDTSIPRESYLGSEEMQT